MPKCSADRAIIGSALAIVAWAIIGLPLFEALAKQHTSLKTVVQLAQTGAPIVAAMALGVAWIQLNRNRANQRETTAKATFREFLKLAVEYPELAEGKYQALARAGQKHKYEWFVAYFLWAAEEILDFDEKGWKRNLEAVAKKHCTYFQTSEFQNEELPLYNEKARALVKAVLAKWSG